MKIVVETTVNAPIEHVWNCWTTPDDIMQWNAASEDWHTTASVVDLRPGGKFASRMEAKDGSVGFDFAGEYTKVVRPTLIEALFGGRRLRVQFLEDSNGILVREEFDAEDEQSVELQKAGWQAILDNFKKHVESAD